MSTCARLTAEQGMAQLASIVGQEQTKLRGETIVAAPADAKQIAEVLRFAGANGLGVTPAGSGSKLGWGNPVAADIELNLQRLHALHEHAWQDMTCTVEAGCCWESMQSELKRHGQMVALDPLWPDRATVGGIVACNDSGALRLKFGGLRDLIIGMTIVLADGTIAKSGGKVVKNVAGYDLHKLMTGSFGTLGVIAEVNFRLHPVEEHVRTWTVTAPGVKLADGAFFAAPLAALMDSQMTPSRVQIRASKAGCVLDLSIAAVPACMDEFEARIQDIFRPAEVSASEAGVWRARQQLFDNSEATVLKVSLPTSEICSVISELRQFAVREGLDVEAVAQATGLMTVAVQAAPDAVVRFVERLRARVAAFGGSAVALQVPDAVRGSVDVWGPGSGALPLMRAIKHRFDPGRTLNLGRFLGNI